MVDSPRLISRSWKRYAYRLIAAEVTTMTRFSDVCTQVAPLPHDDGALLGGIVCPQKKRVPNPSELSQATGATNKDRREVVLLNGNINYCLDVQRLLAEIHATQTRHSRVAMVVYNPFMSFMYALASKMGLRQAPAPRVFVTEQTLGTLATLSGYAVERVRPCLFVPFYIPLLSAIINKCFPAIPFIRRFAFLWVVILRPLIAAQEHPSLTIIVPARNEAGNIPEIVKRLPSLGGAQIELIFVEGHSTDHTWECIKEVASQSHAELQIKTYQQPGKGKNDAVRLGIAMASGDLVTILDADMTMPPEQLDLFYNAYCAGHGDFINGSRLVYPMERDAMRPLNRMGNVFFAKVLARILDLRITDTLCGTKLLPLRDYRRLVAWREHFGDIDPFGDFELLFSAAELVLGTIDVPIRYGARSYGSTNIQRFRDGLRLARMAIIGVFRIKLGKLS